MIHFSIIKFAKIFDGPGLVQGVKSRGGFRGGRGFGRPPSGIQPPADPKGYPLYYFEISIFDGGPLNFSKGAFGANIY